MIRTYLDSKFIRALKVYLTNEDKFSNDFDYYKSLFLFLAENKQNELYLAEKGIKIERNELESLIKREGVIPFGEMDVNDYLVNDKFDFKSINKTTILVFIDIDSEKIEKTEKQLGFFISNGELCSKKWKNLTLNNRYAKSISISFRDYNGKEFDYKKTLNNFNSNCNSLLLVDRYLRSWSKREITRNLFPLLIASVPNHECEELFLSVVTSEREGENYELTVQEIHDYIKQELSRNYNLELSMICVLENKFQGIERKEVQNIMHDRHLMTNYLHLSSSHSFDINGPLGVKKDTEIIVKSLLESSHFSNYLRKRKSYKLLFDKLHTHPNYFILCGDFSLNLMFRDV